MIDLKDYVPEELKFKLPTTVKFPEVIFSDCVSMDDVKKKLAESFVTIQEKDVIANRVMDDYEISTIVRIMVRLPRNRCRNLKHSSKH
jgi:hypothetical protein